MKVFRWFKDFREILETIKLQNRIGVPKWLFYCAILSSILMTYSQLQMIYYLNPLVGGIVSGDFSSVKNLLFYKLTEKLLGIVISKQSELLLFVALCIYGITLLKSFFHYVATLAMGRYSHQAASCLRQLIFQRFLNFGKAYFDKNSVGSLTTVMSGCVDGFSNQLNQLQGFFITLLMASLYFSVLLRISWRMTLVVGFLVPFFNFFAGKAGAKIRGLSKSRVLAEKSFGAKLHEVLTGFMIVKAFNKEHVESTIFRSNSDRELNLKWSSLKWEALLSPIYDVSSTTTFLIIAVLISKLAIIEFVGAANLLVYFYVVQQFIPTFQRFQNYRIEFGKSSSWNNELKLVINEIDRYQVAEGERIFKGFEKSIKFKNFNFSYVQDKPVLTGVSCEIFQGKQVALVGPTGAGKTTLVNLVLRLYDCPANSLYIDGHDIRNYKTSSLRERMAFVSQDIFLFDASVRYNLTYGVSSSFSDDKLQDVAKRSGVHQFVKDLADQYETVIGERGVRLSGGQRQRIALARALLRDAEIFLFDEPTSALDILTEREVVSSTRELLKGKTVVTIAHRLSTIQNSDTIIFINQGQIVAQGTFSELLANNPFFCEFVGTEFKKSA